MKRLVLVGLVVLSGSAGADEIELKSGGRLSGRVVERSEHSVTIEVGPGRISLPLSRVQRIVAGTSPVQEFRARAAALAPDDAAGWLGLGLWAQEHDLATLARQAYLRVVSLDPSNTVAQQGLGNVLVGSAWVSLEESYRARGYVQFEGQWMPSQERDAAIEERRLRDQETATARLREADARVREAEARAAAAEASQAARPADLSSVTYDPWIVSYAPFFGQPSGLEENVASSQPCGSCDRDRSRHPAPTHDRGHWSSREHDRRYPDGARPAQGSPVRSRPRPLRILEPR